jgi:hypothetical protein
VIAVMVPTAVHTAPRLTSGQETEDAESECETNHCSFLSPTQDGDPVLQNRQALYEETLQG